ncbi:S9 family peptidase [Paenibacillus sp. MY03]|uniref:alpha/beta hydrolase family protein n=1 Tax=Paenibacillus sp. MY03 TaxID=302980 RepID=UPI00211B64C1|nr:alpha/beta hydrolase [Paenibacillus sp. MY03]
MAYFVCQGTFIIANQCYTCYSLYITDSVDVEDDEQHCTAIKNMEAIGMRKTSVYVCLLLATLWILAGCGKSKAEEPERQSDSWESIAGTWEGSIQIPDQPLLIIVKFEESKGTISIPIQGLTDYPLSSVKLSDSDLFFDMSIGGQKITFDGNVEEEKIAGTFKQNGQTFPFELSKKQEESIDEGDMVQMEVANGTMLGQLELPAGDGPFPLMIIIAGSGPTDRDGNSLLMPGKNNSLKMIAEQLAAEGVASIRYDKRGIGNNAGLGGKEEDTAFKDFVDDAASWVQFAKKDNRFSKVGIIGHSEGSLVGMAAAQQAGADAYVSIAGAGRPIDQVMLEQLEAQLPANLLKESKDILEQLKQGKQVDTFSAELQNLFRQSVQPYMISWLQYDPARLLGELNIPVLIINGTTDIQVPVKDAELLHEAKKESKLLIIDGMNHVLKESSNDQAENMATYTNPDLPLTKGLIDGIAGFLKEAGIVQ